MNMLDDGNEPSGRDEEAADWCIRFAEGSLSQSEQLSFDKWMADPLNAAAWGAALIVWQLVENAAETPEFIAIRSQSLVGFQRANRRRWITRISKPGYWAIGVAAALLLMVAGSLWLFGSPAHVYQTGIGERRVVALADGSRLSLDADTDVEVRLRDSRRELHVIRGRAKFDVAKDPLRPFTVQVANRIVVATGTSFSVELLNQQIRVLLYEGHVAVLENPGEGGALKSFTLKTVSQADAARTLTWESGQLFFDHDLLSVALEQVNRYSERRVEIDDPALAGIRVSGVFNAGDTGAFLEGLSTLYHVRIVKDADRIMLFKNIKL